MLKIETIIGLLAGLIVVGAYVPQIIKTYKTKDTKGISLAMYIIYLIGLCLYFVYGYMINEPALIITNGIAFIFGLAMLVMKIKYK